MNNTKKQKEINELGLRMGAMIRVFRESKGVCADDMAKDLDVSRQQYDKYESGVTRVTMGTLQVISEYLKINPGAFFPQSVELQELMYIVGKKVADMEENSRIAALHSKRALETGQEIQSLLLRA